MPVTSFDPLLTRIAEVLCDGAGVFRTLPAPLRFRDAAYAQPPTEASTAAHEQKGCIAYITGIRERSFNSEIAPTAVYEIDVVVETTYFVEHPSERAAVRAQLAAAALDGHLVRSALCWPGNLAQTVAGASVGLVDNGLTFRSFVLGKPDRVTRLMTGAIQFTGAIELSHPT